MLTLSQSDIKVGASALDTELRMVLGKGYKHPEDMLLRLNLTATKVLHYCATTFVVSNLSNCVRRKTGAVVVDFYGGVPTIVGSGCNGGRPGGTNECETGPCLSQTKEEVIHAEVNAMRNLPLKNSTRILFCTDSPCENCLSRIEADGTIDLVVFVREYRIMDHLYNADVAWASVHPDSVSIALNYTIGHMNKVIV